MTQIYATPLEAQVAVTNAVYLTAQEYAPKMREALRPFIGKKVETQKGLGTRVLEALPPAEYNASGPWFWYTCPNGVVRAAFKGCRSYKTPNCEIAQYREVSVTLGRCDREGYLRTLTDPEQEEQQLRTIWTVEEVRNLRLAVEKAERALRQAEAALGPFGRIDR